MAENELPPVKEGDIISARIVGTGRKGDGIAKIENYVVIVPNTVEGESYTIRITKVLPTVGFGLIEELPTEN